MLPQRDNCENPFLPKLWFSFIFHVPGLILIVYLLLNQSFKETLLTLLKYNLAAFSEGQEPWLLLALKDVL